MKSPVVRIKCWRARKAREAMKKRIEDELKTIQSHRKAHRFFVDHCPKCDSLCHYRESIRHASLALAQAEKDTLERLDALANCTS